MADFAGEFEFDVEGAGVSPDSIKLGIIDRAAAVVGFVWLVSAHMQFPGESKSTQMAETETVVMGLMRKGRAVDVDLQQPATCPVFDTRSTSCEAPSSLRSPRQLKESPQKVWPGSAFQLLITSHTSNPLRQWGETTTRTVLQGDINILRVPNGCVYCPREYLTLPAASRASTSIGLLNRAASQSHQLAGLLIRLARRLKHDAV